MRKPSVFWSSNALQMVFKLLQAILTARLAGPANMGVYIAAVAIPLILVRVAELGLSQSLGYFTRFDKGFFGHALHILFLHIALALGPVLICVFLMRYYGFGDPQVNELIRFCMLLIAGSVIAQLFTGIVTPMLVAMEYGRSYAFVSLAPPLLFITMMLGLHFGKVPIAPHILVVCDIFSNGVTAAGAAALLWKWQGGATASAMRRRDVYSYALQSYPGILAKVAALRIDRVILAALLPPSALALYSIGSSLRDVALTPSTIFSVTFQNQLVDQVKQGRAYRKTVKRAILAWSVVFALGIVAFWFVSPSLVPLVYGKAFAEAVPVTRILIISTLFLSVASYCWIAMVAIRRPALISISNILGGLTSVVLLWVMARVYGVEGAAWSTVLATALIALFAVGAALGMKPAAGAVSGK